jgi:hypothetical protein
LHKYKRTSARAFAQLNARRLYQIGFFMSTHFLFIFLKYLIIFNSFLYFPRNQFI